MSEHVYSPPRLRLSKIDVLNTLMAPMISASPSLVIHLKTMHAFTAPDAITPLTRAYRRMNYPRSARLADAIIINSESLRSEIERYLEVDARKLKLIHEAVDHDLFRQGDAGAARARVASHGVTRPFVLFVSSLWPYKNCDGLLRAWALARSELRDRQLAIVGPGRDEHYLAQLHSLAAELGISGDLVFVGGVPLDETVCFYQAADAFVYPSLNETFGLPILEAMACGCPVVTSDTSAMPETAGGAAVLCNPEDPASIARAIVEAAGPERDRLREAGLRRAAQFTWGGDGSVDPRCVSRGRRAATESTEMKILVTGGAGFIGSHTCDRLLALGHDVVVLDALTRPVHRNGRPAHLSPETEFYQGDVRNRDLVTNLLRRVDAVYHFAAYQDYLPDFSRFSDVNVVSTALLYEIIVAEHLDLARVVVASSQAAMGEGLYRCPLDGEQVPGMRQESAFTTGQWDIPCPDCGGALEMRATPERISNPQNPYGMSKLGQEMVAINLGRRYGIPTAALRYSIVQGPRQPVYNAYSGACRIFRLSYLLGRAPTLYEDGAAIRDYVNIEDVVDANILVLEDHRAAGQVFNVGGGKPVTTREFADIVRRQYASGQQGAVTGEYRFGDTRHILRTSCPPGPGLGTAADLADSVAATPRGSMAWTASTRCWPRRTPGCGPSGLSGGRGVKAFLLAAGVGSRLRPMTDATPKCMLSSTVSRCSICGSTHSTARGSTRSSSISTTCPIWSAPTWPRASGHQGSARLRAGAARQCWDAHRQPGVGRGRGVLPGV